MICIEEELQELRSAAPSFLQRPRRGVSLLILSTAKYSLLSNQRGGPLQPVEHAQTRETRVWQGGRNPWSGARRHLLGCEGMPRCPGCQSGLDMRIIVRKLRADESEMRVKPRCSAGHSVQSAWSAAPSSRSANASLPALTMQFTIFHQSSSLSVQSSD